jgi:hypothetical protein
VRRNAHDVFAGGASAGWILIGLESGCRRCQIQALDLMPRF